MEIDASNTPTELRMLSGDIVTATHLKDVFEPSRPIMLLMAATEIEELRKENHNLRLELAASNSREHSVTQKRDLLQTEVFGWKKLVNRCEEILGMDSFATVPEAGSVAEKCSEEVSEHRRTRARLETASHNARHYSDKCCKAESEVEAVLSSMPPTSVVRVCDGGGPENIFASLAVSVNKLASQLDAATTENKTLRTCLCIRDNEAVVSSKEGSILIDNKSGNRKRYAFATGDEQALMAKLDEATAELTRLRAIVEPLETLVGTGRMVRIIGGDDTEPVYVSIGRNEYDGGALTEALSKAAMNQKGGEECSS